MMPTPARSRTRLAGNTALSGATTWPCHPPTCLVELIGLNELLGAGQCGALLALVLQELQQLGGTQHAVLARVLMEDLLQLRPLQQPPQELLDLSPL